MIFKIVYCEFEQFDIHLGFGSENCFSRILTYPAKSFGFLVITVPVPYFLVYFFEKL